MKMDGRIKLLIRKLSIAPCARFIGLCPNLYGELLGLKNRVLWITGKMTPLARQQLTANGWTLREGQQL
jgi:hypothetical protein